MEQYKNQILIILNYRNVIFDKYAKNEHWRKYNIFNK